MNYLNIKNDKWLEIVFENRNHKYGAYLLRKESDSITIKSFLVGTFLFASLLYVINLNTIDIERKLISEDDTIQSTILSIKLSPIELQPKIEPHVLKNKEALISKINQVKFNTLDVVAAQNITENVATVEDFVDANPSSTTVIGSNSGEIKVNETTGANTNITDGSHSNEIFYSVQQSAIPKDGLEKFYHEFAQKFNSPELNEGISSIKVILSFVIEKDGSFSNIQILRDPGFGAGKEAVRVLKTMKKWNPAKQNGVKVRSHFSLPILINLNS